MKVDSRRFLIWGALAVAVAIAAYLRIAPMNDREFWGDEAFTGITVRQPWADMMAILVEDVHPPLYYWLLKGWTTFAGAGPMALRAFSVAFGVATVPLAYVAMRDWYRESAWPAIIAAFAVAINPFLVAYSHEARMYALFAFLVLLTAYLQVRSWSSEGGWWRLGFAAALTATMFTHYFGAFFALAYGLIDLARRTSVRNLVLGYATPLVSAILLFRYFKVQQTYHETLGWVPRVTFGHIADAWEMLMFGSPVGVYGVPGANTFQWSWITPHGLAIGFSFALAGLALGLFIRRRWNWTLALLAAMSTLPLVATWSLQFIDQNLFVERYLIGASVALVLFIVLGLARLRPSALIAFEVIYVALVLLVVPMTYEHRYDDLTNDDAIPLVFTEPNDFIIGRYYLGDDANIFFYNAPDPSGDFSGWSMIRGYQLFELPPETRINFFGL